MAWQLNVRFEEMELRDAYWDQLIAQPQLKPPLESSTLRTRLYMARPVVALEADTRDILAKLVRYTLDYWPSAEVSLHRGSLSITSLPEDVDIYLETDTGR